MGEDTQQGIAKREDGSGGDIGGSLEGNGYVYRISDIYLVAFLMTRGCYVEDAEPSSERGKQQQRFVFIVAARDAIEDLMRDYNNRRTTVEPMEYRANLQTLKSLMYDICQRRSRDERGERAK